MLVERRLRPLIVLSVALALISMVLAGRSLQAATGSDVDGQVTVSDATPLVGSTIDVGLAGLDPSTSISVQLCAGAVWESPPGEPLPYVPAFDPAACRQLTQLTTDANGAASGPVDVPTDGIGPLGTCVYESGPGSFSFGASAENSCTLAAVTDLDPADGITPLASTRIAIRTGSGSITGSLSNTDGAPIGEEDYVDITLCAQGDVASCRIANNSPLSARSGSTFRIDGLADGDYTVIAQAYSDIATGSDLRNVSIAGGGSATADLRFPLYGSTSFANSGSGIELTVGPAQPVEFDDTLQVEASGFGPGDQVEVGLCTSTPVLQALTWLEAPRLGSYCIDSTDPIVAVADGAGAVSIDLPYSIDRFSRYCSGTFDGFGGSFSFGEGARCHVVLVDTTGAPSFAWATVDFVTPAGAATIGGTISADGTPVERATAWVSGPVGQFYRQSDAAGGYGVGGQPDGPFSVTARLPNNYYFRTDAGSGAGSFSFGSVDTVTQKGSIVDQQPAVIDVDFDILPGGVAGGLLQSDGSPAGSAWVSLRSQGDGAVYLSSYSTDGGSFDFFGLPRGTYELVAYDFSDFGTVATTTVEVGDTVVTDVALQFPKMNSSISGTVLDGSGAPVAGAQVSGCPSEGLSYWWIGCRYVSSGPDGSFSLPKLRAGQWDVVVYSSFNYLNQASSIVTVGEDQDVTGVELRLAAATGGVSGTVTDETGASIADAGVYVCSSGTSGGGCASVSTGPNGQYAVTGVPDGTYQVSASAGGFVSSSASTEVVDGQLTVDADLILRRLRIVPPQTSVGGVDGDASIDRAGAVFPGRPTDVSADGRCTGAAVSYELRGDDGSLWSSGVLTEEPEGSGDYAGQIAPQSGRSGHGVLSISIDCPEGVPDPDPVEIDIYIDPSGNVTDTQGQPVSGATVTLYRADTAAGPFEVVPDGSTVMSAENRTNPDLTDETGYFGWLTVPGYYKVRAEKTGCRAPGDAGTAFVETPPLPVPPEQVGLELVLDCSVDPPTDTTAPSLELSIDDDPNAAGWSARAVDVSLAVTDEGSGVASCTLVINGVDTDSTLVRLDDGEYQVSARAVDAVGNTAIAPPVPVKVDTVDPGAAILSPSPGQEVPQGSTLLAQYSCSDEGSGIDACEAGVASGDPLDTSSTGERSFSVIARDRAGRTVTSTATYTVNPTAPLDADSVDFRFSGGLDRVLDGPLESGDLRVVRGADGKIQRIVGSGEVEGDDGNTVQVRIDVRRFFVFDTYVGSVRVIDRNARIDQSTPVIFGRLRSGGDGAISGRSSWWTPRFAPYTLDWSVRDAGDAPG